MNTTRLVFASLLAVGMTAAAGTVAHAQIKWDLASVFAPSSADGIAAAHFADLVKEKTNGEIEVTVHYSGALGYDCPQLLEVVETGAVPLASICTTMLGGHDAVFLASTLPFVMEEPQHARVFRDVYSAYTEQAWNRHNQRTLYSYANTPAGLWAPRDIQSADDLANWRLRTFDTNSLNTMTNAGASPINLPWNDVIPGLSTGTISGVLTASDAGFASGFNDYLSHFIAVNAVIGIADATINLDVFDALSPELQEAVIAAGEETTDFAFNRMEGLVAETYDKMRAAGMTVVEVPAPELMEHLKAAGAPVIEDWLARTGDDGAEILDQYRSRLQAAN